MDREIILNNKKYIETIDSNGNNILKRFNDKYNMWVTLKFTDKEDIDVIEKIKKSVEYALLVQ